MSISLSCILCGKNQKGVCRPYFLFDFDENFLFVLFLLFLMYFFHCFSGKRKQNIPIFFFFLNVIWSNVFKMWLGLVFFVLVVRRKNKKWRWCWQKYDGGLSQIRSLCTCMKVHEVGYARVYMQCHFMCEFYFLQ